MQGKQTQEPRSILRSLVTNPRPDPHTIDRQAACMCDVNSADKPLNVAVMSKDCCRRHAAPASSWSGSILFRSFKASDWMP